MPGSRKLRVIYTIPSFSEECVGIYARFHDIIHTIQQMDSPPWEYAIVPLRRHHGKPSPNILFQDGSAIYRFQNYLRNIAKVSREADIVHVVQGDLINSLPPLMLAPSNKPLLAGPNVSTFLAPSHVASLILPPFPSKKTLLYRLKLSRHWRNRLAFANWSPLSRRYRVILAFSDYHKDWYVKSGIAPEKIEVLPTGVRADLFNISGPRIPSLSSSSFSILYVADLRKPLLKGFDVFLEGLKYIEQEEIPFQAWIVGGTADQVKGQFALPINHLSFLGYVPRQELGKYYRSCDVFVNPSRIEIDGTTSVEALACGTPVIGTDIPSFSEKNHLTFRWADGLDLGLKLKEFYKQKETFKQRALSDAPNWSIQAAIHKLLSIYESVVW